MSTVNGYGCRGAAHGHSWVRDLRGILRYCGLANQQRRDPRSNSTKMQLPTLLVAALVLATGSFADSMVTTTSCHVITKNCNSSGQFKTNYGNYFIDANNGCRKPSNVPAMERICMDWNKNRGHFFFKGQNKRCLQRTGSDFDVKPCADSMKKCSRQNWKEVKCTW